MRPLAILATTLAVPAIIAVAQTSSTTGGGQSGFVALSSGSSGGLSNTTVTENGTTPSIAAGNSTWYIDTTRNLIVLCSQQNPGAIGQPSFKCAAQVIQTQETPPAS